MNSVKSCALPSRRRRRVLLQSWRKCALRSLFNLVCATRATGFLVSYAISRLATELERSSHALAAGDAAPAALFQSSDNLGTSTAAAAIKVPQPPLSSLTLQASVIPHVRTLLETVTHQATQAQAQLSAALQGEQGQTTAVRAELAAATERVQRAASQLDASQQHLAALRTALALLARGQVWYL